MIAVALALALVMVATPVGADIAPGGGSPRTDCLVVFDAAGVADRATWSEPRLTAEGIRWVSIGGRIVVEEGRIVGESAGRVLRSTDG